MRPMTVEEYAGIDKFNIPFDFSHWCKLGPSYGLEFRAGSTRGASHWWYCFALPRTSFWVAAMWGDYMRTTVHVCAGVSEHTTGYVFDTPDELTQWVLTSAVKARLTGGL